MKHWHVHVKDGGRIVGALATTYEAARFEASVEDAANHSATIVECDKNCFTPSSEARSPES